MPHYDREALGQWLAEGRVSYAHVRELGGRRRAGKESRNRGWTNDAFRAYADHMAGPEFATGLERLLEHVTRTRVAVMCAEALWWRCHRRLIADALVVRGFRVQHIGPDGRASVHELTPFATVEGTRIVYPASHEPLEAGRPET